MYQRLLIVLSIVFISVRSQAQDVMTPTDGDYVFDSTAALGSLTNPIPGGAGSIQKWVHDPKQKNRIPTATNLKFKSYRIGNLSFRLRFPNNYNPANKYPCIIFLHGAGEAASATNYYNLNGADRENQDQLYWGAKDFSDYIDAGYFNGFILFPQLYSNGAEWDVNTITPINAILDKLQQYNGLDPDRVVTMGLSAGGIGSLHYAQFYPQRIAATVTSCPEQVQSLVGNTSSFIQVPIWVAAGGMDVNPYPSNVFNFRDDFEGKGGDMYFSFYPTLQHQVWDTQWNRLDIFNRLIMITRWNAAHKAQPLVYFHKTQYCTGQPVSSKMELTPGFAAYEWQLDNGGGFASIPGATTYSYTATQAGTYRVHFKRNAGDNWSDWTPSPVVISVKACSLDTVFSEGFETTPPPFYSVFGANSTTSVYNFQNTNCLNGSFVDATELFSQDATGNQGGRFLLHNTSVNYTINGVTTTCTYHKGDQIWRQNNPITVTPNTNYIFSFYLANQATHRINIDGLPFAPATIVPLINDQPLTSIPVQANQAGNVSWQKFSYIWNSGSNTSFQPALVDSTVNGAGNDFAIDQVTLVKYTPQPSPGGTFGNTTLWVKANEVPGTDGSPVAVWSNKDFNGYSLVQDSTLWQPTLKNNAADNINFNPVVSYLPGSTKDFNQVRLGFAGTAVHNAAHIYAVAKFNTVSTSQYLIAEGYSGSELSISAQPNGVMRWYAGDGFNAITTANNAIVANQPALWSFSKDNLNNTASGNKQDIRKNGVVLANTNHVATLNGNSSDFNVGIYNRDNAASTLDGKVAEVIYLLDSTVDAGKENRIESYLALKYGATLGNTTTPVNYTASDGITVFWTARAKFQNDVFGIGTDSASALVQKMSNSMNTGSGDGTGQSGKGNIVLSATTNLSNKQFLVIGNSAATLAQHVIVTGESNPLVEGDTRVGRNWLVANTGSVGPVVLSFDTTGLGNQSGGSTVSNYFLMVSPTGDTTYNGTLAFFAATSASGKKITFTGATLPDGAAFTVITNNVNSALPAVWLGFTADASGNNALLKWKTADEVNVDKYVVEHSFNGVTFSAVGSVNANNFSGENNYSFIHTGLAPGTHFYRIRRLDKDGRTEYSVLKSVKIPATTDVQVRPNPVVGSNMVLAVSLQQATRTDIEVMSADGKVVAHQNVSLNAGNNLVNINISIVPPGIYLVRVQLTDEVITRKFIRSR